MKIPVLVYEQIQTLEGTDYSKLKRESDVKGMKKIGRSMYLVYTIV
jgi:hypothetical protein